MPAKKKYFTIINSIHLIHKACQILSTFISECHCPQLYSQCLHLPRTPILFPAIPQPIISRISCTQHTALLKTPHNHFW